MISEGTQIDAETCVALIPTGKCVCHPVSRWRHLSLNNSHPLIVDGGKKYIYTL